RALVLDLIELDLDLPDLLRARLVGREDRRRILPLTLRARDLVARSVLLALQSFQLRNQPPPAQLQCCELFELVVQAKPAVLQSGANFLEVIPDVRRIQHALVILYLTRETTPEIGC